MLALRLSLSLPLVAMSLPLVAMHWAQLGQAAGLPPCAPVQQVPGVTTAGPRVRSQPGPGQGLLLLRHKQPGSSLAEGNVAMLSAWRSPAEPFLART